MEQWENFSHAVIKQPRAGTRVTFFSFVLVWGFLSTLVDWSNWIRSFSQMHVFLL